MAEHHQSGVADDGGTIDHCSTGAVKEMDPWRIRPQLQQVQIPSSHWPQNHGDGGWSKAFFSCETTVIPAFSPRTPGIMSEVHVVQVAWDLGKYLYMTLDGGTRIR